MIQICAKFNHNLISVMCDNHNGIMLKSEIYAPIISKIWIFGMFIWLNYVKIEQQWQIASPDTFQ